MHDIKGENDAKGCNKNIFNQNRSEIFLNKKVLPVAKTLTNLEI